MKTTLEEQVASFIRQNKPREIWVDCVAVALKMEDREEFTKEACRGKPRATTVHPEAKYHNRVISSLRFRGSEIDPEFLVRLSIAASQYRD